MKYNAFFVDKESKVASDDKFSRPSEAATDESVVKRGLPYSSHHKRGNGKSESVIYIPSNEEEFDAEISRLDYVDKSRHDCSHASCFDDCLMQQDLKYNELLESFTFTVQKIKPRGLISKIPSSDTRRKLPEFKCNKILAVERKKEFLLESGIEHSHIGGVSCAEESGWLYCDKSMPEVLGSGCSDLLLHTGSRDGSLNKTDRSVNDRNHSESMSSDHQQRPSVAFSDHQQKPSVAFSDSQQRPSVAFSDSQQSSQQNNFVEINLLAVDPINEIDRMNTGNLSEIRHKNLRDIVRALIKKIFESPKKNLKRTPPTHNYGNKQKEVKISVEELFKNDNLDFIVKDHKKINKCGNFITSRKFIFLQLCFLAILSIYFMSYFNAYHAIKL